MSDTSTIHVGVLRLGLTIPGARSLKDRRRALASLRDRLRHRFEVTWSEIPAGERHTYAVAVLTTAGNDARLIRSILDRIVNFVELSGKAHPTEVDVDVFPWHPRDHSWGSA